MVATGVSTGASRDATGSRGWPSVSVATVVTTAATGDGETGAVGSGAVAGGGVRGADLPSNESMDEDELRIESVKQRAGRIYLDAGVFEFAIVVVGDSG